MEAFRLDYLAVAKGEEEGPTEGIRRGVAAGTGAARRRGVVEALRLRTAARKEREAAPRNAMVRVSPEMVGTMAVVFFLAEGRWRWWWRDGELEMAEDRFRVLGRWYSCGLVAHQPMQFQSSLEW